MAQALELRVHGVAVGQYGGCAINAGEAVGHEQFAQVILAHLHEAEEPLLLAAAHGVFPPGPDHELLAGQSLAGELFAEVAQRHHLRVGDVEVAGLVLVAVLEFLVGFGAVHIVKPDDQVAILVADVEAVTVHVAIGKNAVLQLFPLAGGGVGGERAEQQAGQQAASQRAHGQPGGAHGVHSHLPSGS